MATVEGGGRPARPERQVFENAECLRSSDKYFRSIDLLFRRIAVWSLTGTLFQTGTSAGLHVPLLFRQCCIKILPIVISPCLLSYFN